MRMPTRSVSLFRLVLLNASVLAMVPSLVVRDPGKALECLQFLVAGSAKELPSSNEEEGEAAVLPSKGHAGRRSIRPATRLPQVLLSSLFQSNVSPLAPRGPRCALAPSASRALVGAGVFLRC